MHRNINTKRREINRLIPSPIGDSKVLVTTLDISKIKRKFVLNFIQDVVILNRLRLRNILPSTIIALSPMSISIEQTALKTNLYSFVNNKISIITYFSKICEILLPFHSMNYIHGNLKPSNILFNKNGNIYISDYFLNQIRNVNSNNYINTTRYISPEQRKCKEITLFSDVWSLGMILYFLCEKKEMKIVNGRINLSNNKQYEYFINKMLKINPLDRLSVEEILLAIKRIDLKDDQWISTPQMYRFIKENAYVLYYDYYHKIDYSLRSKIDYKLMDNDNIMELNFEWSDIGDIGCEYLYDYIKSFTSITNLNLWANLISDEGVYFINLKCLNNLKYINLGCIYIIYLIIIANKITDTGLKHIVDQFQSISKLIQLNICRIL